MTGPVPFVCMHSVHCSSPHGTAKILSAADIQQGEGRVAQKYGNSDMCLQLLCTQCQRVVPWAWAACSGKPLRQPRPCLGCHPAHHQAADCWPFSLDLRCCCCCCCWARASAVSLLVVRCGLLLLRSGGLLVPNSCRADTWTSTVSGCRGSGATGPTQGLGQCLSGYRLQPGIQIHLAAGKEF